MTAKINDGKPITAQNYLATWKRKSPAEVRKIARFVARSYGQILLLGNLKNSLYLATKSLDWQHWLQVFSETFAWRYSQSLGKIALYAPFRIELLLCVSDDRALKMVLFGILL